MKEFEPSMSQIDDFTGQVTEHKNKIVRNVIIGLLVLGGVYSFAHNYFGTVEDQYKDVPYLLKRF